MFREMRRSAQLLTKEENIEILETCTSGVLALNGDDEYPYSVPLSFAYKEGKLYFHFAINGYKTDAIGRNNKVSFCVIKQDNVLPEAFNTLYKSVIVFGKVRILTEKTEKQFALESLLEKYSSGFMTEGRTEIEKEWDRVCAAEVVIEHMTGKASKELVMKEKHESK